MIDFITSLDDYSIKVLIFLGGIATICAYLCIKIGQQAARMPAEPRDELVRRKPKTDIEAKNMGPRYFDKLDSMELIEPDAELRDAYRSDKGNLQQANPATMEEFLSIQSLYELPTPRGANAQQERVDMLIAVIDKQQRDKQARLAIDALHPQGRRV